MAASGTVIGWAEYAEKAQQVAPLLFSSWSECSESSLASTSVAEYFMSHNLLYD